MIEIGKKYKCYCGKETLVYTGIHYRDSLLFECLSPEHGHPSVEWVDKTNVNRLVEDGLSVKKWQ